MAEEVDPANAQEQVEAEMAARSAFDCIDEAIEEMNIKLNRCECQSSERLHNLHFQKDVFSFSTVRGPPTHLEKWLQQELGNADTHVFLEFITSVCPAIVKQFQHLLSADAYGTTWAPYIQMSYSDDNLSEENWIADAVHDTIEMTNACNSQ